MFVRLSWRPIDDGVVVVTAPQCGQTAPLCRNAEAETTPPAPGPPSRRNWAVPLPTGWLAAGLCPPARHCCRLAAPIVLCCVFEW